MGRQWTVLWVLIILFASCRDSVADLEANQSATLTVDASLKSARPMPDNMFGIDFEEINHSGAGGLWAELVSNRGFEAGGQSTPSDIDPWSVIGNETYITLSTDLTSCFDRNQVALRMEVLCNDGVANTCPSGGVGIYNPGYWGMNIEQGKTYNVVLYVKSLEPVNFLVSLTSSDGLQSLATAPIIADASQNWTKVKLQLKSGGTNSNSRIQLTTSKKGVYWFDQVSVMPSDTYMGHGFRKELASMLENLKPRFIRFPGGDYVKGARLQNAFRWRETIGPWEERPGHFNDIWDYWTDDGLGFFEFLQLAEDLGASPVWVVNSGISKNDQVDTTGILPFVKDILNGIEFARGNLNSTWGSVRAAMGHAAPFKLNYVSIGNQDCQNQIYRGNYLKFYGAIKAAYSDIKIVSNCDGSTQPLDHPADLYDFHLYLPASNMFSMNNQFDHALRNGPKAFVSEYAVHGSGAGQGSLLAALAEASFLLGLERNSDVVEMASYAPLLVNVNNIGFSPDAIFFNSWQQYGTPSYWMQHFFRDSNGATFHPSVIKAASSVSLAASAITWKNSLNGSTYLKLKIVNFGSDLVNLTISVTGMNNAVNPSGSAKTVLTSANAMDENSFGAPKKVVPMQSTLPQAGKAMNVVISPHSFVSFDLLHVTTSSYM